MSFVILSFTTSKLAQLANEILAFNLKPVRRHRRFTTTQCVNTNRATSATKDHASSHLYYTLCTLLRMCIQYFCPICRCPYIDEQSLERCSNILLLPYSQRSINCPKGTKFLTREEGTHAFGAQCRSMSPPARTSIKEEVELCRRFSSMPTCSRRRTGCHSNSLGFLTSLPDYGEAAAEISPKLLQLSVELWPRQLFVGHRATCQSISL